METTFFYHSFPRRQQADSKIGLEVLGSILESGLLLTPEVIRWREPGRPTDQAPAFKALQIRACFTELPPADLPQHAERFGRFALEFTVESLRELGAIPVFYVPNGTETAIGFNGAAQALVMRVAQVQDIISRLKRMKNMEPLQPGQLPNAAWKEAVAAATEGLPSCLEEFVFSVIALLSLLFPAENLTYTDELGYYRQREWRIIENFALNGVWPFRELTPDERTRLLAFDAQFFERVLDHPAAGRVIERCRMFSELQGLAVIRRVKRFIVPAECVAAAHELVQRAGLVAPVVALETLRPGLA